MQYTKRVAMVLVVLGMVVLGGCQPWKEKYQACNADLENLQALFDSAQAELQQCNADRSGLEGQLQRAMGDLQSARKMPVREKMGLEKEGGVYDPAKGTITVTLTNDVLFDSGMVTLKSASKTRLGRITDIIKREHAGKEVWVVGHTDTDPIKKSKWTDNWQLSTERALAVTRYLISQGIDAKQLVAAGRAEFHPIGQSKAENRRVEIVVSTR